MDRNYHHGDLKIALIENGIELLNAAGEKNFSLRQLAIKCGVSHAAPYSHYKNKEEILLSMREYVIEKFIKILTETINEYKNSEDLLVHLGITYIDFFIQNPNYYNFLFTNISNKGMLENLNKFEPFNLFHIVSYEFFENMNMDKDLYEDNILLMWSLIHGLTYVFLLQNELNSDWKIKVTRILKSRITFQKLQ